MRVHRSRSSCNRLRRRKPVRPLKILQFAHAHGHEWSHEIDINADPPMVKQDPINLHGPEAYMASLKEEIY